MHMDPTSQEQPKMPCLLPAASCCCWPTTCCLRAKQIAAKHDCMLPACCTGQDPHAAPSLPSSPHQALSGEIWDASSIWIPLPYIQQSTPCMVRDMAFVWPKQFLEGWDACTWSFFSFLFFKLTPILQLRKWRYWLSGHTTRSHPLGCWTSWCCKCCFQSCAPHSQNDTGQPGRFHGATMRRAGGNRTSEGRPKALRFLSLKKNAKGWQNESMLKAAAKRKDLSCNFVGDKARLELQWEEFMKSKGSKAAE